MPEPAPAAAARYAARDAPRTWQEFARQAGKERCATYCDLAPNEKWPYLTDGVYVEVSSYDGARPLVWACATRPSRDRCQLTHAKRYDSWDAAMAAARAFVKDARAFLRGPKPSKTAQAWKGAA